MWQRNFPSYSPRSKSKCDSVGLFRISSRNQLPWHGDRVISKTKFMAVVPKVYNISCVLKIFSFNQCPILAWNEMQTMNVVWQRSLWTIYCLSDQLVVSHTRMCCFSQYNTRWTDVTHNTTRIRDVKWKKRKNEIKQTNNTEMEEEIYNNNSNKKKIMCYAHSLDFEVSIGSLVRFIWPTYQSKCVLFTLVADANK